MSTSGETPHTKWVRRQSLALLTDFYELTMLGGYHATNRGETPACFDYFFRTLPHESGYAIFAGLNALLDYLDGLTFTQDDIEYLSSLNIFKKDFLAYLAQFELHCDVYAPPEGTVVFPNEPAVRVEGPLMEAQLIETFLLNALNYPTLIATKASRICEAAQGEPVIEFGLRRAQGPDGGLTGSRAAYIGGCSGTSNVLAGRAYGIPVSGTMAHSWIMAMPSELDAFRAYVEVYPENPILLVDTYDDIHSGIPNAIAVFKELRAKGRDVRAAIRLDSGDLARLSKIAYEMMTAAGFKDPMIVASNELEEDLIADLKRQGARINAWGVGTHLITGKGDPSLSGVYKLSALETDSGWDPRLKISSNPTKTTDPGVKRIVRYRDRNGHPVADLLCAADEAAPSPDEVAGVDRQHLHVKKRIEGAEVAEELLWPVVENGKRVAGSAEDVHTVRQRALEQVASLPDELKRLRNPERYPVLLSPSLARRKEELLVHYSNEK